LVTGTLDLAACSHAMSLIYGGVSNCDGSTSASLTQTVSTAASAAVVESSGDAVYGQSVTFTATVSAASGHGTPTGTVSFFDGTRSEERRTGYGGVATCTNGTRELTAST